MSRVGTPLEDQVGQNERALASILEDYEDLFESVAETIYTSRARFLRNRAETYIADTVYFPEDDEYIYWPARDEGFFEGFLESTPRERDAIERLEDRGFEHLGNGAFRHAFRIPYTELVLKVGRGGPNRRHFDGRWQNLSEAAFANQDEQDLVLPCLYCAANGAFAIYPLANPTLDAYGFAHSTLGQFEGEEQASTDVEPTVTGSDVVAFRRRLAHGGYTSVKPVDQVEIHNVGVTSNGFRLIDVNVSQDARVKGLPLSADPERVITRVDRRRAFGEKLDVAPGGGLIDPDV